ncbi:MAG: Serine/threonine protein kinase, partial [Labilithrix sp.]|nr:Serine/threonine protein kinase [Labilithrix sp.]
MQRGEIVAGKYRLNQPLGSGGMAEVWSATNTFTERQVAIKFMNAQVAKTPEAAARFLKEAKVSARVNHPNIIDIHDVGQTEQNQLFLVMELLTGFPLEVAIRRQTPPMTLYEFAIVMLEVGDALMAAHKAGIVHRDLKPTNIYLHKVKDGVAIPKLLDFGVSKFLEEDTNHALTVAGTVLGSPLYMSPEQARGESNLDGRTDIFAFGAILFEALCGYRAYEAKNFNALIV